MTTSTNPTITTGCTVYVRKGCPAYRINKGFTFTVLLIEPMGAEYGHRVKIRLQVKLGQRPGDEVTFYARHMNRLSDPFTRLSRDDPTKNIEVEFLKAPVTQENLHV
jgi:hypothetical protein